VGQNVPTDRQILRRQSKPAKIFGHFVVVAFLREGESVLAVIGAGMKIGSVSEQHFYNFQAAVGRRRQKRRPCPPCAYPAPAAPWRRGIGLYLASLAPPGGPAKATRLMEPTDTSHPDYFHRVVDCQWACPAHTDVPEYIRLIAQGRFTDAYMVNRHSNVFPGILGRVCDRPCEPACRRARVESKPVAICRLKRVAADHRDDVTGRLPKIPKLKNGKRIACIGAGCASLTVANDLLPLGYEVTIFEQYGEPGGLMRTNIPSFRLPQSVLEEEIGMITGMGVDLKLNHPVESLRELLANGGFDAVFVGSGAPKGKELSLPGRQEGGANIHIGISWLESVAFGHIDRIGERVLIIGVGNTAVDCCRSSHRWRRCARPTPRRRPIGNER